MVKKNICIITPTKPTVSETFIQAHIDLLTGNKFLLHGQFPNYIYNNRQISNFYQKRALLNKLKKLLPHFIYEKYIISKNNNILDAFRSIKNFFLINNIEIILAEYGNTGAMITPIAKELNIPLIVHFHGTEAYQDWYIEHFSVKYIEMFKYAKSIISVSNNMTKKLISLGASSQKITLNPYGPQSKFENVNINRNSNKFIGIGRFTDKKAPYITIMAFEKLLNIQPDAELLLIGEGPLLNASKTLAKVLKIDKRIIFLGAQNHEVIINYINQCFCFVQHSIISEDGDSEGTPVAILEAGASGLPVVSTRHAGIIDAVIENVTGILVDEKDVDGMAKAMIRLFENRDLAFEMGNSAKKHISSQYNIQTHIQNIQNLINN
jgi:colanic acid/amylovoran biosynthesis glycosyltransferase